MAWRRRTVLGSLATLACLCLVPTRAHAAWTEDVAAARRLLFATNRTPAMVRDAAGLLERSLGQQVPDRRVGEVCYLLGRARCELGDAQGAITALRQATSDEPTSTLYRLWLGTAYQLDARLSLAARLFRDVYADPLSEQGERKTAQDALTALHESPELDALLPSSLLRVPGALIHYHEGDPTAADVRECLAEARERLDHLLGIKVDQPIEILVFGNREEYLSWHAAKQIPRPEWSTACTAYGRISLYADGSGRDGLVSTLTHEYTHAALRAAADDRPLPCWVDEGLAVLVSRQFADYRTAVAKAPALLDLTALSVPSFSVYGRDDAYLAYAQSKAMVEDLLRLYGAGRLRTFLRALGTGQASNAAFEAGFGVTPQAFFDWWLKERANAG